MPNLKPTPEVQAPRPTTLSRQALYELVWIKPMTEVAADLGLSPNGLAKICDRLLIPYAGRGHWSKARRPRARITPPPLPHLPQGGDEMVSFALGQARSRRTRTRLPPNVRAEQLIEVAAAIIAAEGLHAASLKRVAREIGISESQAHSYFNRQSDLLVALARRELLAVSDARWVQMQRATDHRSRVALSTVTYLQQAALRGTLIQRLLNSAEVRARLRSEHEGRRHAARSRVAERMQGRYGVPTDRAFALTAILTSVTLRAGRLLTERKIDLETAERLTLAIVTAGNRRLVDAYRAPSSAA
jgi:AcrR family transcriptional regulator